MSQSNDKAISFEEALAQLESVVAKLESGETSLEESVALYEQGVALAKFCEEKLNWAASKVQELTMSDEGALVVRDATWLEGVRDDGPESAA
jgi:exodeoxyribonuclease VII small subunit